MKVLFAIKEDNGVVASIERKFKQDEKAKFTYNKVDSLNAMMKELQKSNYNRVVVSEDFDDKLKYTKNTKDQSKKYLKKIVSSAGKAKVIFCANDKSNLKDLVDIDVYNIVIGKDKIKKGIYDLLNNPNNKEKAIEMYGLNKTESVKKEVRTVKEAPKAKVQKTANKTSNVKASSGGVNDLFTNIKYLNREDLEDDKYVKRFDSISSKFDKTSMEIIVKSLSPTTKKILRKKSSAYNELLGLAPIAKKSKDESSETESKRRGRPRKEEVKQEDENNVAKRRGRPRKEEEEKEAPKAKQQENKKEEKKEPKKKSVNIIAAAPTIKKSTKKEEVKIEDDDDILDLDDFIIEDEPKKKEQPKKGSKKIEEPEEFDLDGEVFDIDDEDIDDIDLEDEVFDIEETETKDSDEDDLDNDEFDFEDEDVEINEDDEENEDFDLDDDVEEEVEEDEDEDFDFENEDDIDDDEILDFEDDDEEESEIDEEDDEEDEEDEDFDIEDEDDIDDDEILNFDDDDEEESESDEEDDEEDEEDEDFDIEDEDDIDEDEILDFEDDDEEESESEEEDEDFDLEDEDDIDEDEILNFEDDDEEESEIDEEDDDILNLDEDEDDEILNFDDDDEEDEENQIEETEETEDSDENDILNFDEEDESDILSFDDDENDENSETETSSEEDDDILNFDEDDSDENDILNFDVDEESEEDDVINDSEDDEETEESNNDSDDDLISLNDDDSDDDLISLDDDEEDDDILNLDEDEGKEEAIEEAEEDTLKINENDNISTGFGFAGIQNKNYNSDNDISKKINEINEEDEFVDDTNSDQVINTALNISQGQKIVAFVGGHGNGTSFIVNNMASLLADQGISVAILDVTKNKNSYYIYTENQENLRGIAYSCFEKLSSGIADGIKVNKNLTVYTSLPNSNDTIENKENALNTILSNSQLVLIDCDVDTEEKYFELAEEIYLVQSLDILTIQPLTSLLKKLKMNQKLDESKLRVLINKEIKVNELNDRILISAMSVYNSPDTTYQLDLFNRDTIQYLTIPFEEKNYCKYLGELARCKLRVSGYSKSLINSFNKLAKMIYPIGRKRK